MISTGSSRMRAIPPQFIRSKCGGSNLSTLLDLRTWGGLRGALALALALALPTDLPYREDILIVAFAVVAFSVIVQGPTARFALRWLQIDGKGS